MACGLHRKCLCRKSFARRLSLPVMLFLVIFCDTLTNFPLETSMRSGIYGMRRLPDLWKSALKGSVTTDNAPVNFNSTFVSSVLLNGHGGGANTLSLDYPPKFYRCREPHATRKLFAFIHVFKTGGSSVSQVLRHLAGSRCGIGVADLNHVSRSSSKGKGRPTTMCWGMDRTGLPFQQLNSLVDRIRWHTIGGHGDLVVKNNTHGQIPDWLRENVDMVSAHCSWDFPETVWHNVDRANILKGSFVRDPTTRFVSARIQAMRTHGTCDSVEQVVNSIRTRVWPKRKSPDAVYYNGYWQYLATAAEKLRRVEPEEQVEILKRRLDSLAFVGVMERWSESMALLQRIVAPSGNQAYAFSLPPSNVSPKVSTAVVMERLVAEPKLWTQLQHAMRHERVVYEHGVRLHLQQCQRAGIGEEAAHRVRANADAAATQTLLWVIVLIMLAVVQLIVCMPECCRSVLSWSRWCATEVMRPEP